METLVKAFDAAEVDSAVDVKSIVSAYYGRIGKGDDSRQIKIGFGQQGDKFYKKTNFCVWSVLVGIGHPPQDEISALVCIGGILRPCQDRTLLGKMILKTHTSIHRFGYNR